MECGRSPEIVLLVAVFVTATPAHAFTHQETTSAAPLASAPLVVGRTLSIPSRKLGENREVRVYLPASHADSKQRFPVLYVLDGETLGPVVAAAAQFLAGAPEIPRMPEAVVVAILNTDRGRDMPIPQEMGKGREDKFLAFLADELVPVIDRDFRTQPLRVLVGHSQSGTFAYHALTARPSVFQWYLAMDAPLLGFPQLQPMMNEASRLITNPGFHGRLVAVEAGLGWGKQEWQLLTRAAPSGFHGARVEISGETHETMVFEGVYEGLTHLFDDFAPDSRDLPLAELEAKYATLSRAYGYRVDVPLAVLLRSASRNATQQRGAEAVELVERAVALYGESSLTRHFLSQAEGAKRKGGPDPRVAEIMSAPPPSVNSMKPFVGKWEGTREAPGDVPLNYVFVLEADDSGVRARCTVIGPDGTKFEPPIPHIRVLACDRIQWGLQNGRSGLTLFDAKLVDADTLAVTEELIGITPPAGMTMPPAVAITLKRVKR